MGFRPTGLQSVPPHPEQSHEGRDDEPEHAAEDELEDLHGPLRLEEPVAADLGADGGEDGDGDGPEEDEGGEEDADDAGDVRGEEEGRGPFRPTSLFLGGCPLDVVVVVRCLLSPLRIVVVVVVEVRVRDMMMMRGSVEEAAEERGGGGFRGGDLAGAQVGGYEGPFYEPGYDGLDDDCEGGVAGEGVWHFEEGDGVFWVEVHCCASC